MQKTDSQLLPPTYLSNQIHQSVIESPVSYRRCLSVSGGTVQSKSYSFTSSTSSSNASRKVGRYVVVQQWDVDHVGDDGCRLTVKLCFTYCQFLKLTFLLMLTVFQPQRRLRKPVLYGGHVQNQLKILCTQHLENKNKQNNFTFKFIDLLRDQFY